MQTYFAFLPAILYGLTTFLPAAQRRWSAILVALACVLHGAALVLEVFAPDAVRVGFAMMLSTATWVTVLVFCFENRHFALDGLKTLLLPVAALLTVLPVFFPGQVIVLAGKSAMFPWHLGVASLTYCTLTVAACHAIAMKLQNSYLHELQRKSERGWLNAAVERLPALMTMEKILYRLIFAGFVLLTLTVLSGVVFSEQVLGVAFKWDHKTIFSLLSWLLFAVLLFGQTWWGWRGKKVLSVSLVAFTCLLLAYVGSRFVLEVVLHRSFS